MHNFYTFKIHKSTSSVNFFEEIHGKHDKAGTNLRMRKDKTQRKKKLYKNSEGIEENGNAEGFAS